MHRPSSPELARVRQFVASHSGERSALLLAKIDDGIVGTINLSQHARPQMDHSVAAGFNVAAGHRSRGSGRRLLEHGLEWARCSPDIERIELEVMANNVPALRLYESLGFVREEINRQAVRKPDRHVDVYAYALWVGS